MGKRTRHESSSSSSSEEDRSRKRQRSGKKEKHAKKEKKHKEEKHKNREKSEDLVKQAKKFLKAQLSGKGDGMSEQGAPEVDEKMRISEDDYFAKNNEFTTWLQEDMKLFYNDLNNEQTHDLFGQFVKLWNAGRLAQKYYVGAVAAPTKRTAYNWKFKGAGGLGAEKGGMQAFLEDQKMKKMEDRAAEKQEQRRWRAEQKEQLDELLPKATGREARIEQRMARREDAKAREASPDLVRLPGGGDIFGGDDSIAAARAREASRQSAQRNRQLLKHEQLSVKAAAAQAKEDEKMAAFRALVEKGPIQIRKRE